jgi:antitoxin component YwqK of YwqJK toxin-antitoxin module
LTSVLVNKMASTVVLKPEEFLPEETFPANYHQIIFEEQQPKVVVGYNSHNNIHYIIHYLPESTPILTGVNKVVKALGLPTISNCKRHGRYQEFYTNQQLRIDCYYQNGQQHGTYVEYYDDGNIKILCQYIDDELEGKYCQYYKHKNQLQLEYRYQNGKLEGRCLEYHSNGNLKRTCGYKAGLEDGMETTYSRNGVELEEFLYREGRIQYYFPAY